MLDTFLKSWGLFNSNFRAFPNIESSKMWILRWWFLTEDCLKIHLCVAYCPVQSTEQGPAWPKHMLILQPLRAKNLPQDWNLRFSLSTQLSIRFCFVGIKNRPHVAVLFTLNLARPCTHFKSTSGLLGTPPGVFTLTGSDRVPSPFLVKAAT